MIFYIVAAVAKKTMTINDLFFLIQSRNRMLRTHTHHSVNYYLNLVVIVENTSVLFFFF